MPKLTCMSLPNSVVVDHAQSFMSAARLLEESQPGQGHIWPELHCRLVASELFLKSYLVHEQWELLEGDLGVAIIKARGASETGQFVAGHKLANILKKNVPSNVKLYMEEKNPDVCRQLELSGTWFVKLRYIYEDDKIPNGDELREIRQLSDFLDHFCKNVRITAIRDEETQKTEFGELTSSMK